jgi:hypothetical protein
MVGSIVVVMAAGRLNRKMLVVGRGVDVVVALVADMLSVAIMGLAGL